MDVAFVSNVVYPFVKGGAEKRIYEIGRRLADRHEVTIYGRHFWNGPTETGYEGMTLRAVGPDVGIYNDDGQRSITEAVDFSVRLMSTLRPHVAEHDLVVASVFPYFPVLSSKFCTVLSGVPLVTTWHEVWGQYWHEYLGPLAPGGKLVELTVARLPQHPVAVSENTADRLAAIGPARDTIDIVPNGINIDQVEAAPLPKQSFRADGNPGFDLLFAGRLIEDKRVDVLLEAFDRVAEEYDVTLGIIGNGPDADKLRARAGRLDAFDRVTFLGFLDKYEDVLGHMRAARVFVSPSTREGFGITYVEAMAAGCTVIAADHPGSAANEVIGDAGYAVEPTVEALADVIDRVLSGELPPADPTERAKQFDWDAIARRAETVYRRALTSES